MKHLAYLTLGFSLLFAAMLLLPPFTPAQFGPYPLLKFGDVIDLFTPLVLIPLYWLLLKTGRQPVYPVKENIGFLLLAALWVEGQGMHLAANAIGHLLEGMPQSQAYALTNFVDEYLSHYLWHAGVMGLSAVLIGGQWNNLNLRRRWIWPEGMAGVLHGFLFFIIVIEGNTVPMGFPFAVISSIGLGWRARHKLNQQPLLAFFFVAYLVATLLFIGWRVYWGDFRPFSQLWNF